MSATEDPQITAWRDQYDRMVSDNVRTHGVHLQFVFGETDRRPPDFAYTVGLFGIGHPELIVCGTGQRTAGGLLNELARQVRDGRQLVPSEIVTFRDWSHRVAVEECPNPGEIIYVANDHYQRPDEFSVPALQLTHDDLGGRFPWEQGYSIPDNVQPRPGTWRA